MAKYRFRLETLRKLRAAQRDEMRRKLAEAHQAAAVLDEQQAAVAQEIADLQAEQRSTVGGSTTDVNRLLEAHRYQAVLRAQQATLKNQAQVLAQEVERRRERVVESDRQVRVLDKLDERKQREHRQEAERKEVKQFDEIASRTREADPQWAR
jgi:flagellar protein FliJ